jgi:hypothetical protein
VWKAFNVVLLACLASAAVLTNEGQSRQPVALWTKQNIRNLHGSRSSGPSWRIEPNRAGVVFLDDSRLLTYEVASETGQLPSSVDPEVSSTFNLRLSMLDSGSGELLRAKDWPTRQNESSLNIGIDKILLRTGPRLRILGPDFSELQQLPLNHPDPYERWEILTSPDRATVLLNHSLLNAQRGLDGSHFYVLDGSTLVVKNDWNASPAVLNQDYASSNAAIALEEGMSKPRHLVISTFGTKKWKTFWNEPSGSCGGRFTFLTDQTIAYVCNGFLKISTDGQVLFKDTFQKGESQRLSKKFSVSKDGKAVSILLDVSHDFWDTNLHTDAIHIAVYNPTNKPRAVTLDIKPLPKDDFDFALSPDGSKLAVLNDQNISVYSIPTV